MFTIKIEQHFNKKSLNTLKKSIGKSDFKFILDYVHTTIGLQTKSDFEFSPNRGVNLSKIVSSNSLESIISNVIIPPFFYPYNNLDKNIQIDEDTKEKNIDWGYVNSISVSGELLKMEIYNFREEVVFYDVYSMKGHVFEDVARNPPENFDCLKVIFDYFVYLVFFFEDDKILIVERPESSEIIKFHYNKAEQLLKYIREYRDDDSNRLQYYLAHEIS